VTADGYISMRDWCRKPPLRLRVTEKAEDVLVVDQVYPLPAHGRRGNRARRA
jgi:hypothetical protein